MHVVEVGASVAHIFALLFVSPNAHNYCIACLGFMLQITKRSKEDAVLIDVSIGPKGEWFVMYKDGAWKVAGIPDSLAQKIDEIHASQGRIRHVNFGAYDSWFVRYIDEKQQLDPIPKGRS